MSNYPSQDPPSWAGHSTRDDNYGRASRAAENGSPPRRNRQPPDMQGRHPNEGTNVPGDYGDRDFYDPNSARQNFDAYRGNRNQPWPRNEDRENYSAAPEYRRPDQYFDDSAAGANRRRDNRSQSQAFDEYQNRFNQNDYGAPAIHTPQYGIGQRGLDQPRFFQADDFSHRGGYTRSEYPEDSYLRHGQYAPGGYSMGYQQAGATLNTQNWQEREGAQRGAFGLRSTHRGRGPQGYTRSDERIKEDICERLSEHHYIDASQIRVEVSQGVVTLEGSVYDRWQKYQTEDLVDATSGVNDIQNRLNVSRDSRQGAQWTAQPNIPQSATAPQQATAGDLSTGTQGGSARKNPEKSEQNERGKPGFTSN